MVEWVVRPVILEGGLLAEGKGEGYHHHEVLPKTTELLSRASIEADPVGSVADALKAHVNLIATRELMYATTLLGHEATDPEDVRGHVLDLLYGSDDLSSRVERFTDWAHPRERGDGAHMGINATVASYLLAASQPDRYAFCKPTVYKPAARALVGDAVGPARPAERVAHATQLYQEVLRRLREDHGVPFEDLMHVHMALYVVDRYDQAPGWAQLVEGGRPPVAEPEVGYGVDQTAFRRLFDRFVNEYAGQERGVQHLQNYAAAREDARRRYTSICERADSGDDVTADVLLSLLPHKNTSGNRAREAWIHPAEAVTKDVQMWFEGAGWVDPEDWPAVAEALLTFVRTCVDAPDTLAEAADAFEASSYGKGLQAGMLSPILSALRPKDFSVINSKAARLVNRLTGGDYRTRLSSYPAANAAAQALTAAAGDWIEGADLDADAAADVLDMMAHWLVTEGPPEDDTVPLATPLDAVFASADEAEWAFDLLRDTLGQLGVDEPGDPRVVLSLPRNHEGTVLRLNFGPWLVLDFRGDSDGRTRMAVALRSEHGQAIGTGAQMGEPFAEAEGRPEQAVFEFAVADVRPVPSELGAAIEASMGEIRDRFSGWGGSSYARHHRPQIEAAVFDDAARDVLFRDGLDLPPSPPDVEGDDVRAWKVSPGDGAWPWDEAREGGFIGVGWEDLGDLSGVDEAEFRRRQSDVAERFGWTTRATNQVWRFATEIRVGDRIVANRGTTEVLGVGTVTGPYFYAAGERHAHRLPVRWDDTAPKRVRFGHWRQTLLSVPQADFQEIVGPRPARGGLAPEYPLASCAEETGIAEAELARWVRAVERKGQAVFYGPPGTGKTYVAERIARHLVGGGDGFVETVQFHPAYGYEDFVEGIRPRTEDGQLQYPLEPGRLLQFCAEAEGREGRCVLVVDEINRANLSRVFGELMYLMEYRDRGVTLASGQPFSIPANVRILGTMNTADRSIALVDHALRRRFAFVRLWPDFDVLRGYHRARGTGFPVGALVGVLEALNEQIGDPHYAVGISYFLDEALGERVEDVWRMEIEPYLEEYFFDRPESVEPFLWREVERALYPGAGA